MKEVSLKDHIKEISMGPFGSNIKIDNFISSGAPVLNGSNLSSHKLVEDGFKYISKEKANSLGKANAKRGDIVITHRGTLGQVAYIPFDSKFERYVISQSQFRVRFKDSINPIYFAYLMLSKYGQKKLLSFKNHVGVPALAQATTNFKLLELFIPDIIAQNKIASVLSGLDDKIELNNKINSELEAMAKTLYEYWFVQFDFPNVDGKPYKSSGSEMVYDDVLKREIPKGWEVKSLLDIANFINGLACQKYRPIDENSFPVIKIREMNDGISANTERVRKDIPSKYIVNDGDVLFSWSASLDVKIWAEGIGGLNQHIFKVTSSKYPKSYYYFELLNYLQHFKMMAELRKTTMGHITQEHLRDSKITVPNIDVINKLDDILNPIFQKILINKKQNQELASLRDWLLPMLMNGQITVKDAYGEIEEELGMIAEQIGEYNSIK